MLYKLLLICVPIFVCGQINSKSDTHPIPHQQTDCDSIPPLNQEILDFVDAKMGKKVGNGQCWTLAAQALDEIDAKWDQKFKYGTLLNPEKDCIYPGDIIQFRNVKFVRKDKYEETMEQHTAIVYKVLGKGRYTLAHQNTEQTKKRVGLSDIDMADKKSGKMWFYRPTK
jgi:hypothetical protein